MKRYLPVLLIVLAVMSLGLSKKKPLVETPPPAQEEVAPVPENTLPAKQPEAAPAAEKAAPDSATTETPAAPEETATAVPAEVNLEDFTVAASKKKDVIVIKVFSRQFNSIAAATLVEGKNSLSLSKQNGYFLVEVPLTKALLKAKKLDCKVYVKDQQSRTLFKKVEINL